jgi:hypothetical protein
MSHENLAGDFNGKAGRQGILKSTNENKGLHGNSNENGRKMMKFDLIQKPDF